MEPDSSMTLLKLSPPSPMLRASKIDDQLTENAKAWLTKYGLATRWIPDEECLCLIFDEHNTKSPIIEFFFSKGWGISENKDLWRRMVQDGNDIITCGLSKEEYYEETSFWEAAMDMISAQLFDDNFGEQELRPVYDIVAALIDHQMAGDPQKIFNTNYCLFIEGHMPHPSYAPFILGYTP